MAHPTRPFAVAPMNDRFGKTVPLVRTPATGRNETCATLAYGRRSWGVSRAVAARRTMLRMELGHGHAAVCASRVLLRRGLQAIAVSRTCKRAFASPGQRIRRSPQDRLMVPNTFSIRQRTRRISTGRIALTAPRLADLLDG
jgi:hypothetical protein